MAPTEQFGRNGGDVVDVEAVDRRLIAKPRGKSGSHRGFLQIDRLKVEDMIEPEGHMTRTDELHKIVDVIADPLRRGAASKKEIQAIDADDTPLPRALGDQFIRNISRMVAQGSGI